MALRYGLPLFLEDKTGRLTGSEFIDLYDRMKLMYRRLSRDPTCTDYGVFDITYGGYEAYDVPKITLKFGADNSLGTIKVGRNDPIAMETYLPRVTIFSKCNPFCRPFNKYILIVISSKSRHYIASDGQQYRWRHRYAIDQEWACTNSNGEVISYYSLKLFGEPHYPTSSGCMLTVEENYPHLACEMLATAMIMRHINAHNL